MDTQPFTPTELRYMADLCEGKGGPFNLGSTQDCLAAKVLKRRGTWSHEAANSYWRKHVLVIHKQYKDETTKPPSYMGYLAKGLRAQAAELEGIPEKTWVDILIDSTKEIKEMVSHCFCLWA